MAGEEARSSLGDPSPRTIEAVVQAVSALEDKFEVKFTGYEDAVKLLQEFANRQPTTEAVNENLRALKELSESKLLSLKELIDAKFEGNKTALDAALKTQKESSDKIESNFTKQFENIVANMGTMTKSFEDKITEVKDRYNTSQGLLGGVTAQRVETRENVKANSGLLFGLIGAIAVLVPAAIAILGIIMAKGG